MPIYCSTDEQYFGPGMRMTVIVVTTLFLFLFSIFCINGCKKSDENEVSDVQVQQALDIANNQQVYYDSLMMYLALNDTAEAISRTMQLIRSNTEVSSTLSSPDGIQIIYSNGMLGGILLNPGDYPELDTSRFQKSLSSTKSHGESRIKTIPTQKKTIFLNPHLHNEFQSLFNT